MGIIKKQAIQSMFIMYFSVVVGFVNAVILLPLFFLPEEVGLLGFLVSFTAIIASFATFGLPIITVKYFPHFRNNDNGHNGFLSYVLRSSLFGIGSGILFFFLFKSYLISGKNAASSYAYFSLMFCIVFAFKVIARNLDSYAIMLYKTVIGILLEGVIVKVLILLTIVSWSIFGLDFDTFFIFYSLSLASSGMLLIVFISRTKTSFKFKQFKKTVGDKKSSMITVGLYGIIGSIGSIIVLEVDRIMVSNKLGLYYTGIYSVAFFFGLFVSIPARGLRRISLAILSESWKNDDLENIQVVYRKSCANLLLIAGYLFLGIWFIVPYLFQFMRPEYSEGLYVILFIGLAHVVDMMTGVNNEIILTSTYYKYNTYFTGVLVVVVIVLNYIFIPIWGINGAAAASFIAMITVNTLRYLFLYIKFKFKPFTFKTLWNVILMGAIFATLTFIPKFDNETIGILITGSTITILYWIPAYKMNLSGDINLAVDKMIRRFISKNYKLKR